MVKDCRLTGEAVKRILCVETGEILGHLYRWNNGDEMPMWIGEKKKNVTYEECSDACRIDGCTGLGCTAVGGRLDQSDRPRAGRSYRIGGWYDSRLRVRPKQ